MFGKIVQRLIEPGASFFGDIGRSFDGDVVVMIDLARGTSQGLKVSAAIQVLIVRKVQDTHLKKKRKEGGVGMLKKSPYEVYLTSK
jgi:hypothetical protein